MNVILGFKQCRETVNLFYHNVMKDFILLITLIHLHVSLVPNLNSVVCAFLMKLKEFVLYALKDITHYQESVILVHPFKTAKHVSRAIRMELVLNARRDIT